jgi:hypothetical protein
MDFAQFDAGPSSFGGSLTAFLKIALLDPGLDFGEARHSNRVRAAEVSLPGPARARSSCDSENGRM